MKKVSPRPVRFFPSPAVAPLVALTVLASVAFCQDSAGAQSPTSKSDDAIAKSVAQLEEIVAKAELLLKAEDRGGAREACKEALAVAALDRATPERLAAADGVLWRLGLAAYNSGDLRAAHDAWQATKRHREATLPDDHPELQNARQNLANTNYALGDLPGALALQEKVFAVRANTLPDDHPELQNARRNLALTKYALGDLPGALALQEKVLAMRAQTLPDDHPNLQKARLDLANTNHALGDLPGALALQEKVLAVRAKTLPDDHPDLQTARFNLALTKFALHDLPGALALQEKVFAVWSKALPDDHPNLQAARQGLVATKFALGDLPGALELNEKFVAVRANTLPDDHPDLQTARLGLANTKYALGDLPGALELHERVFAVRDRTLPDDHPDLQEARHSLAATKYALGDLSGALELQKRVFAVREKTLPDDHPDLQAAYLNLASTKYSLGDLPGALALQEKVFAVRAKTLPDDHPDLQGARLGLANTKKALGDLPGALALEEKVFAVRAKTLPDDHPDLQTVRFNLASTKHALGDLPGALALQEKVLAVLSKALPDDHLNLQTARQGLAATKYAQDDLLGTLALMEKVFAVRAKALPDDHPDLQMARQGLAATKYALGDLPGALELQEKVFAVRAKALPDDHPDLQEARLSLANTKKALGDLAAAGQLHRAAVAGAASRLSTQVLSLRDAVELAGATAEPLSHVGSLLNLGTKVPADTARELSAGALHLLEATRSASLHLSRLQHHLRAQHPETSARLLPQLAAATRRIEDAIALPAEGHRTPDGKQIARDDAIREATLAKDALEREWLALIPPDARTAPDAAALAKGLAQDEIAISFCTYTCWTHDPEKPWITTSQERYGAFVLTPSGAVTWHSLAPIADIETLIAAVRKDAEAGFRIATRSATDSADALPGRNPKEPSSKVDSLTPRLTQLRTLLLDPVLSTLPSGTKSLVLSLADEMHLVPLDDLPLVSGKSFGEAFALRSVWSLRTLTQTPPARPDAPTALVVGGADYDAQPDKAAPTIPEAATPIVGPTVLANATDATERQDRDTNDTKTFSALPGTTREAEKLKTTFTASFEQRSPDMLLAAAASEAAFVAQAPTHTFLHVATHGYFAPESAWTATDGSETSALSRFDAGRSDRVAQLSPYSLTGIALAGANLPADELGRREGILTAQEIALLDLSSCYLATLSACNTSLGVRRAGTGLASLRQSFHAAGARFVLATLWKVNDSEAETLMADFYTRIWKQGQDPHTALREAKRAARQRGAAFRDWAGWVLTGR